MATFNHGPTLFAVAFVPIILIHQTYSIYKSASPMATFNRGPTLFALAIVPVIPTPPADCLSTVLASAVPTP